MGMFESKVRQVGSSLGVLIPKEITVIEKIKKGQVVKVLIIKKNLGLIEKAFGMAKGAKSFRRGHNDRVF